MKLRKVLFWFYVTINTVAYLLYSNGYVNSVHIVGEFYSTQYDYFFHLIFLLLSLVLILKLSDFIYFRIKIKKFLSVNFFSCKHVLLGWFILLVEIVYLYNLVFNSSYRAGGVDDLQGGFFGVFVALFQIQFLPLLYFCSVSHRTVLTYFVIFLCFLINVIQGWSGIFFILFIIYNSIIDIEKKRFGYFKFTFISLFLIFTFYPLVYLVRGIARGRYDILSSYDGYFDFALHSYTLLIERFEQYHLSLGTYIHKVGIADAIHSGVVVPYYYEGVLSSILAKFYDMGSYKLGDYLPSVFYNIDLGSYTWNVSPGFVSLFYINDFSSWIYIFLYYFMLMFLSLSCIKLMRCNAVMYNFYYFSLILYLFAGWFSMFSWFCWAILVLFLFNCIFGLIESSFRTLKLNVIHRVA
ncbi:oligosaccharide repeat unit polymerase [Shewanella algae]|uniref:oligosaccharide repeat unit polymerase n=1 Tax=Shewanella algae TaxID=38313 RepID=UPI001183ED52|nr:oligosaccharide repeat unit polymerase [Shewanella algae]TVP08402.1 hypothetical protein AYI73_00625 [Shewanella algae]